ncbi:MAG: 6-bladed beta-propeller [Gemmatimonadota bacterium]
MAAGLRPVLLSLMVGACGAETEAPRALVERADSAGIEVVRVLGAPPDTVRMGSPAVRIGSTGIGGAEHEVFELLSDLAVLPGGRVAVVDNRGARVAVFDSTGQWRYDLGRRGEGPGEYRAPSHASVRADTLFVWDALGRRLLRYADDGTFLGARMMPDRASAHPFAALADGYLFEVESGQLMDPAPARAALVRADRDGEPVDTLVGPYPVPEYGWQVIDEESGTGAMTNPPALSVRPRWTVAAGGLYRLDPEAATIEVRTLDAAAVDPSVRRPTRIVRLPYEASPPSLRDREAYFRALEAGVDVPEEVIARERAATEFVALRPPVADLRVDDRGRLWVAGHDPAAPRRSHVAAGWDVIDIDRADAVHVEFPDGFELKAVRDGRAYGITTLETAVHVVDVFRLPGTPPMSARVD